MKISKSESDEYGVVVLSSHSATIEWMMKDSHRDNYACTDKIYDALESHWSSVSSQFSKVKLIQAGDIYDRQKSFTLCGDDAQMVLAAGKEMAMLIFSHEFVVPVVQGRSQQKVES